MRTVLLAIAAGALLVGAAQAKDSPNVMAAGRDAAAREREPAIKKLYVCDAEELSWRAFSRDFATPDFVTAEQVRADSGKTWGAPKCITEAELRRLSSMTQVGYLTPANTGPAR